MNKNNAILILCALGMSLPIVAQKQDSQTGESEYKYYDMLQIWRNTDNSAAMVLDSACARGIVEMGINRRQGNYYRVQEGDADNSFVFYTERYQTIGKYFYGFGSFFFNKGRIQNRAWSDVIRTYESNPFISGSSVPGRYDYQNFGFKARVGSVDFGGWRVGLGLDYSVGDLSRLRDPRSRNRLLDYKITPALSYSLGTHTIGLSGFYNRRKEKMPSLTTVQNDLNLLYYQLSGLGAVTGTIGGYSGFAREYVNHAFGGELNYGYCKGMVNSVNSLSLCRNVESIFEQYKREPGKYYVYSYGAKTQNRIGNRRIIHQVDAQADFLQGYADENRPQLVIVNNPENGFNSYRYDNILTYRKRYQIEKLDWQLHYRANILKSTCVKRYIGFLFNLQQVSQKHLLPTSTFDRSSVFFDAEYGQSFFNDNRLWMSVEIGYLSRIKADLNLGGIDNLYTQEVLLQDISYYQSNYIYGSVCLKYQFPIEIKKMRSLWYVKAHVQAIHAMHNLGSQTFGFTLGVFN